MHMRAELVRLLGHTMQFKMAEMKSKVGRNNWVFLSVQQTLLHW